MGGFCSETNNLCYNPPKDCHCPEIPGPLVHLKDQTSYNITKIDIRPPNWLPTLQVLWPSWLTTLIDFPRVAWWSVFLKAELMWYSAEESIFVFFVLFCLTVYHFAHFTSNLQLCFSLIHLPNNSVFSVRCLLLLMDRCLKRRRRKSEGVALRWYNLKDLIY